jgi:hypothetical protein
MSVDAHAVVRMGTKYDDIIKELTSKLEKQKILLSAKENCIKKLEYTIKEQKNTIEAQKDTIEAQKDIIEKQEDVIKKSSFIIKEQAVVIKEQETIRFYQRKSQNQIPFRYNY